RVLAAAQEDVGLFQRRDGLRRQVPGLAQVAQHRAQAAVAQARILAAADQLEQLHDELQLADAAGAELEVVLGAALVRVLVDQRLQLAQRAERAEVEVAAIDEGLQAVEQGAAGAQVPRDRTGLDHGVALPLAAML